MQPTLLMTARGHILLMEKIKNIYFFFLPSQTILGHLQIVSFQFQSQIIAKLRIYIYIDIVLTQFVFSFLFSAASA